MLTYINSKIESFNEADKVIKRSILSTIMLLQTSLSYGACGVVIFGKTDKGHVQYINSIQKHSSLLGCRVLNVTGTEGSIHTAYQKFVSSFKPGESLSIVQMGHNDFGPGSGLNASVPFGKDRITYRRLFSQVPAGVRLEVQSSICGPSLNEALTEKVMESPKSSKLICGVTAVSHDDLHRPICTGEYGTLFTSAWRKRQESRSTDLDTFQEAGLNLIDANWSYYSGGRKNTDGMVLSSESFIQYAAERSLELCDDFTIDAGVKKEVFDSQLMHPLLGGNLKCEGVKPALTSVNSNLRSITNAAKALEIEIDRGIASKSEIFTDAEKDSLHKHLDEVKDRLETNGRSISEREITEVRNKFAAQNPELVRDYNEQDRKRDRDQLKKIVDCLVKAGAPCLAPGYVDGWDLMDWISISLSKPLLTKVNDDIKLRQKILQREYFKNGSPDWTILYATYEKVERKALQLKKNEAFDAFLSNELKSRKDLKAQINQVNRRLDEFRRVERKLAFAKMLAPGKCPSNRKKLIEIYRNLRECETSGRIKPNMLDRLFK